MKKCIRCIRKYKLNKQVYTLYNLECFKMLLEETVFHNYYEDDV